LNGVTVTGDSCRGVVGKLNRGRVIGVDWSGRGIGVRVRGLIVVDDWGGAGQGATMNVSMLKRPMNTPVRNQRVGFDVALIPGEAEWCVRNLDDEVEISVGRQSGDQHRHHSTGPLECTITRARR
jgi:hypothetical protein